MKEKLVKLYNTLSTVETKGVNTKIMADCLRFIEGLVAELERGHDKDDRSEGAEDI